MTSRAMTKAGARRIWGYRLRWRDDGCEIRGAVLPKCGKVRLGDHAPDRGRIAIIYSWKDPRYSSSSSKSLISNLSRAQKLLALPGNARPSVASAAAGLQQHPRAHPTRRSLVVALVALPFCPYLCPYSYSCLCPCPCSCLCPLSRFAPCPCLCPALPCLCPALALVAVVVVALLLWPRRSSFSRWWPRSLDRVFRLLSSSLASRSWRGRCTFSFAGSWIFCENC